MQPLLTELPPHLQKAVDAKVPALDIMHGELKSLMLDAEEELMLAQEAENASEEAIDSMERRYWEGQLDALSYLYSLTYQIAFAEGSNE